MVRFSGRKNLQTKVLFRTAPVVVDHVTSQQICDAIYKRLALHRFFTHHTVHRVSVNQFLAMLAAARLRKAA